MHLITALRAFFAVLWNGRTAKRVDALLRAPALTGEMAEGKSTAEPTPRLDEPKTKRGENAATQSTPPSRSSVKSAPVRSDALTLLSALQREARFLDLVHESLDGYSDAQIGSAARDVLRDSKKVLDRMFAISPLSENGEGSRLEVPANASAFRIRVLGHTAAGASVHGVVTHPGWVAKQCLVPEWSGNSEEASILAPMEVEVAK